MLAGLSEHLRNFDNRNPDAPPRQKTLCAAIDWSYRLLTADEAFIFRSLSVFAGSFDLADVLGVLGPMGFDAYRVTVGLGVLVAKSLVVARAAEDGPRYRLLDSARIFAAGQAKTDAELGSVEAHYTTYLVSLLEKAEQEWVWKEAVEWRNLYGPRLNDLRQALDWCFGRGGRPDLGFRLTVSALPLWDELSSIAETEMRVDQALARAGELGAKPKSMARLLRSRAWHMLYAEPIAPQSVQAWEAAIGQAQQSGEVEPQLQALWGFAVYLGHTGKLERALGVLEGFRGLATRNEQWESVPDGDYLHAIFEIYLGRLESARAKLDRLAQGHPLVAHRSCAGRFIVHKAVQIRTHLSFLLWLMGQPDRALHVMDEVNRLPDPTTHTVTQIGHLAWSCLPVSHWAGDIESTSKFLSRMRAYLEVDNIPVWQPIRLFYRAALDHRQGHAGAVRDMQRAIDRMISNNLLVRVPMYLGILGQALLDGGDVAGARMALRRARAVAREFKERWSDPELLRLSASVSFAEGDTGAAEEKLQEARRAALESGATYLALRAANDLAEIYLKRRCAAPARDILQPVLGRFPEEFRATDMVRASKLLREADARLA